MGTVDVYTNGWGWDQTTTYIYCDRCGSWNMNVKETKVMVEIEKTNLAQDLGPIGFLVLLPLVLASAVFNSSKKREVEYEEKIHKDYFCADCGAAFEDWVTSPEKIKYTEESDVPENAVEVACDWYSGAAWWAHL